MAIECTESFYHTPMFFAISYSVVMGVILVLVALKFKHKIMNMRSDIKKNRSRDVVSKKKTNKKVVPSSDKSAPPSDGPKTKSERNPSNSSPSVSGNNDRKLTNSQFENIEKAKN